MRYERDTARDELLRLAESLSTRSLTALSPGIGLGAPRPAMRPRPTPVTQAITVVSEATVTPIAPVVPEPLPKKREKAPRHAEKIPYRARYPRAARIGRWVLGHIADISVVSLTIAVTFAVAALVLTPQHLSLDLATWRQWQPVRFVSHMSVGQLLIGVYLAFGLYWVLFKVSVGMTLGQAWLVRPVSRSLMQRNEMTGKVRGSEGK